LNTVSVAALSAWSKARAEHVIPITGTSMLPLIRDGDRLVVAHGWAKVRRGDVIVFRKGASLIAHRVLRIRPGDGGPIFITKGDNAPQCDLPLKAEEIVGRVRAIRRNGRRMSLDTSRWRLLGWLIATGMLVQAAWHDRLRRLAAPIPESAARRLAACLRRCEAAIVAVTLRAIQAFFCRWEA